MTASPDEERASSLEAELDAIRRDQRVVGLSVAAVHADGTVWSATCGDADLSTGRSATAATTYPWFSMTKIVTATAIMQLVQRGSLGLDDPVVNYVPEFAAVRGPAAVTIRHLLSHSSGLANPIPLRWVHPASTEGPDPAAFLATQLRRHRRLRSTPGTRARYTNLGYLVLGQVVAAAADAPYEHYIRTTILEPLGMTNTTVGGAAGQHETTVYQRVTRVVTPMLRLALPHGIIGERSGPWLGYRPFRVHGLAYGGLIGSAHDAAQFLVAHLRGTVTGSGGQLDPHLAETMQQVNVTGKPYDFGLGWYRPASDRSKAPRFVEQLGGGLGIYNVMRLYPDLGIGLVVMANTPGFEIEAVISPVLNAIEQAHPTAGRRSRQDGD